MKKKLGSLVVCVALLSVVLPAAGDEASMHAAVCQHVGGPGSGVSYGWNGVEANGEIYVVCPVGRDRGDSSSSLNSAIVEVYIPSGGFAYCQFYSQGEDGSAGTYVDIDTVYGSTAGESQLTFNSVTSSGGDEGAYSMFCDLSDGTIIHHIRTNESDSADD
jgi:hypothetical protein